MNPDASLKLLACQYMRKQSRALLEHMARIPTYEDIEHIHQTRVASRRLRAALSVFNGCFSRKAVRRWRKDIKRLTIGLGPARDLDVQIEYVAAVLAELPNTNVRALPGTQRLLLRLQQDRLAGQPSVVQLVERVEASGALARMHRRLEQTGRSLKKKGTILRSEFALGRCAHQINKRIKKVLSLQSCLQDGQAKQAHHQMRIACKKLRYTLEMCDRAYDGRLDEGIRVAKQMQSLLGDVHDCDVWIESIDSFIEQERQRTAEYFGHDRYFRRLLPGLEYLKDERRARRDRTFAELKACWDDLEARQFWAELRALAQSGACPQVPSQGAADPPAAQSDPCAGQRDAECGCCGRNHLEHAQLSRIDSGQLLCADCLAELRIAARRSSTSRGRL